MSSVFLTANEARSGSRDNSLIFTEIRSIESEILTAVGLGNLSVTISDTVMTATDATGIIVSKVYSDVWQSLVENKVLDLQMNEVIDHFKSLGYSIVRMLNTTTNTTFVWVIMW